MLSILAFAVERARACLPAREWLVARTFQDSNDHLFAAVSTLKRFAPPAVSPADSLDVSQEDFEEAARFIREISCSHCSGAFAILSRLTSAI